MSLAGATPAYGIYVNNRAAVFAAEEFALVDLIALAVAAETAGFDFVSVGDSPLAKPRYAPIVVLSAIAAQTSRIELSTGILQPHMRNPVLLAQEWATLDVISGGRTTLGVGLGTGPLPLVEREYELVGIPKRRRGKALDEAIDALRALWSGGPASLDGEIFDLGEVDAGFGAVKPGGPPIYIACGGYVPKMAGHGPNDFYRPETADRFTGPFDRVARVGDGWITGIVRPFELSYALDEIRTTALREHKRHLDDNFVVRLNCFINVSPDEAAARAEGVDFLQRYHGLPFDDETIERWLIAGPPERCADKLASYVDAGVNSFQLVLASTRQTEQLERVAAALL